MRRRIATLALVVAMVAPAACHDADRGEPQDGNAGHVVAGGDVADRDTATFVLTHGADVVRIRAEDLGGDLYRVATPDDARVAPTVQLDDDQVVTTLTDAGGTGPAVVEAELARSVPWRVRLDGGATEQTVDLTGGKVDSVALVAGVSHAEVSLPPPTGTVTVSLAGGASRLAVHLAAPEPVRVRIGGGASTVTVDGERHTGVAAGAAFTPPAWASATDRYDIDITAGVSTLSVDRSR